MTRLKQKELRKEYISSLKSERGDIIYGLVIFSFIYIVLSIVLVGLKGLYSLIPLAFIFLQIKMLMGVNKKIKENE